MIATTGMELVQTIFLVLGALGIVGIIAAASAITSIRNNALHHEQNLAFKHEEAESHRHRATLDHQAAMRAIDRADQQIERAKAIEEGPPIRVEPRHRKFRRPV